MMIEIPQRSFIGRVNPKWFARVRPLHLNYTGSSSLSDYSVSLSLSSSDIPFGKLRSDKQDLLFLNSENEIIPYAIESANSSLIRIWLRFREIKPERETFWMYYGNPDFTGASDLSSIFYLYDEFNESSSLWNWTTICNNVSYEISDGLLTINASASNCVLPVYQRLYYNGPAVYTYLPEGDFETKIVFYNWNPPAGDFTYRQMGALFVRDKSYFIGFYMRTHYAAYMYRFASFKTEAFSSSVICYEDKEIQNQTFRYLKVIRTEDNYHFFYSDDDVNWSDFGEITFENCSLLVFRIYISSGSLSGSIDSVYIRKKAAVEPVIEM